MDYVKIIKDLASNPEKFFKNLKKFSFTDAIKYFAVMSLVFTIAGLIFTLLFKNLIIGFYASLYPPQLMQSLDTVFRPGYLIGISIVGFVGIFLMSFVIAAIMHIWLLIFGAKTDYKTTYKLYTFARTPLFLIGWIPVVSYLAILLSYLLLVLGTPYTHKMKKNRVYWAYGIPIALMILSAIFSIYYYLANPIGLY